MEETKDESADKVSRTGWVYQPIESYGISSIQTKPYDYEKFTFWIESVWSLSFEWINTSNAAKECKIETETWQQGL